VTETVYEPESLFSRVDFRVIVAVVLSTTQLYQSLIAKRYNQNAAYYYPYNHKNKVVKVNNRGFLISLVCNLAKSFKKTMQV
jgi:hypothetical protein